MSIYWHYKKDHNLTFKEAEEIIKSIGFTEDKSKGWVRPIPNKPHRRHHFVHSVDCFNLHEDKSNHTVAKGEKVKEELYKIIKELKNNMNKTRVRKVPIKTFVEPNKFEGNPMFYNLNHTNFAEEIYQQQKTDKFFNRIFYTGCVLAGIALIILVIVNIK
jgi:hypothetical protein